LLEIAVATQTSPTEWETRSPEDIMTVLEILERNNKSG
jgi:hypothetical protein